MYARGILIPGEDPAEFERFRDDFLRELKPSGTVQTTLVRRSAELAWKLKRLPAMEAAMFDTYDHDLPDSGGMGNLLHQLMGYEHDGVLMRLQRYETRLEKSFRACLHELRLLKADAAKDEAREREPQADLISAPLPAEKPTAGSSAQVSRGTAGGDDSAPASGSKEPAAKDVKAQAPIACESTRYGAGDPRGLAAAELRISGSFSQESETGAGDTVVK